MLTWMIDPAHSRASFAIRHLGILIVRGTFHTLAGTLHYDPATDEDASVDVTIDVRSLKTPVAIRDSYLMRKIFRIKYHRTIHFKSRRIEKLSEDRASIMGDLTINGIRRAVTLQAVLVEDRQDASKRMRFEGWAVLNRSDFTPRFMAITEALRIIGQRVEVRLEIEVIPAKVHEPVYGQ
ncbi:MAG: YceI family protein [Anaerolineae bacterium]|nr:YceI family protein [Anaerolineae bacterium]